MINILILGNGFIGSRLYAKLNTIESVNINILSQSDVDYTEMSELDAHIREHNMLPDAIINACGYTGVPNVDACEGDKSNCWRLNTVLPVNLANYCSLISARLIHISSGCIYNGYSKVWTEADRPNFGIFNDSSSFYSKSKHAAETLLADTDSIIFRIRMPFTMDNSKRNYLNKILQYDNIISMDNSVTCVEDFISMFIDMVKYEELLNIEAGAYNIVNPEPTNAEDVVQVLKKFGLENPNWKIIPLSKLETKANRSNCVLSSEKLASIGHFLPPTRDSLVQSASLLSKQLLK